MRKNVITLMSILAWGVGLIAGTAEAKTFVQVKGSDTEVNVVQRLAENYMKKDANTSIAVTGGGSGVGIAAIINKTTDLANSSRPMKDSEVAKAKANGVNPVGIAFAVDGLSVIVNPKNSLKALTMDQIGQIYRGEVTNWKQVGGPDGPITLYGRQPNSGTFVFFREFVVKADYSPHKKAMNGNAQIVEGIQRDKAGIGYVAVGYVVSEKGEVKPGVKVLNIAKDAQSEAFSPAKMENVMSGHYPISRPLNHYLVGKPSGKLLEFIKFELSPEGQEIVRKQGFFPVQQKWVEFNKNQGAM